MELPQQDVCVIYSPSWILVWPLHKFDYWALEKCVRWTWAWRGACALKESQNPKCSFTVIDNYISMIVSILNTTLLELSVSSIHIFLRWLHVAEAWILFWSYNAIFRGCAVLKSNCRIVEPCCFDAVLSRRNTELHRTLSKYKITFFGMGWYDFSWNKTHAVPFVRFNKSFLLDKVFTRHQWIWGRNLSLEINWNIFIWRRTP
jgi:hypothetical protein